MSVIVLTFSKVSRGILFQWGMTAWEPERAKMAAKPPIFASTEENYYWPRISWFAHA